MPVAGRAAAYGAIGAAMARPGHTLDGRTSSGEAKREQSRDDIYTIQEINSIVAAVASLPDFTGSERQLIRFWTGESNRVRHIAGLVKNIHPGRISGYEMFS